MNNKKLLIVNGAQFGHSSGHYLYSKYLQDSFDIRYICYDRGLERIKLEGIEIIYVSFEGGKLPRIIRLLKECVRQSKRMEPDILFVTYFNLCSLLAIFCRSKNRVLDIRTGSLNKYDTFRIAGNLLILFQSLFFSRIVILSESMRARLLLPRGKSRVVPLGSEVFCQREHTYKQIKLLYVGTLNDRNITETINGTKLFLQKNETSVKELSYIIIGFGSEVEILNIKKSIEEYGLIETVKFEGRKSYHELVPYFDQSNIGIVYIPLTRGYDCQPSTKLFEYLLSGMPVIATNTHENRLIVNKLNGVLINDTPEEFCKGLELIYGNRNYYVSSVIRESAMDFTWEHIVNTNLKPYLLNLSQ